MFAFASLDFRFSRMLAGLLLAGLLLAGLLLAGLLLAGLLLAGLLLAGLLLVAAVATWLTASGPARRATRPAPPTRAGAALPPARTVSLQTPPLTGRFPVGTMSLRLADRSRRDPSSPSGVRELMVQFWYPAQSTRGHAVVLYMPAQVAQLVERYYRIPDHLVERLRTRAYTDVPITPGHHAVLLYSPGLGDMRSDDTALEENLASDGFVVVAIDHTHEAQWVQFPDGRIVPWSVPYTSSSPYGFTPAVALRRVDDLQFVVAELSKLDRGNPVLRGALDLERVGAFGFSLGGSTAANAMKTDPQVRAGADLDGAIHDPVLGSGLSRPFMIMLDPRAFAYFRPFVRRLTGPYLVLQARREPTRCVHGRRMAIGSRAAGRAKIGRGARTGLGERVGGGRRRKRIPRRLLRNLSRWAAIKPAPWAVANAYGGQGRRPPRVNGLEVQSSCQRSDRPLPDRRARIGRYRHPRPSPRCPTVALTMTGGAGTALLPHVRAYLGGVGQLPRNARAARQAPRPGHGRAFMSERGAGVASAELVQRPANRA
jgi:hypothetical protein